MRGFAGLSTKGVNIGMYTVTPPYPAVHCLTPAYTALPKGERWKELYKKTAAAVAVRSPRPWDFDISSIFAHIDAFLQRCNDLLEVGAATSLMTNTRTPPLFEHWRFPCQCWQRSTCCLR